MLDIQNHQQPQQQNDERLYKLQQLQNQLKQQKQKQQQHLYPNRRSNNDDDAFFANLSLSSSPSSFSSQFSPVATTAAIPSTAAQDPVLVAGLDSDFELLDQDYDFSILGGNDLMMQSEPWLPQNQLTAGRPLGHHNIAHHRESSLSSLGSTSAGPASPFSQNTSNPHIAVSDTVGDGYANMSYYDDHPSFQLMKTSTGGHDGFYNAGHAAYAPPDGLPVPPNAYGSLLAAHRQKGGVASNHSERGLQPPPDLSIGANRSQPVSVASSVASNSPATPSLDQADDEARRRNVAFHAPPKLDRTMTDVYSDELYSQNFPMPPSSQAATASHLAPSPSQEMFAQRLQQINNQHLSAASHQVPVTTGASRERSPFRHGSPLAPAPSHDFSSSPATNMRFSQQQQQQQQQRSQQQRGMDANQAFRSQVSRGQDTATPQTISPKDAVLEYREPDEGDASNYSLFAQGNPQGFSMDQMNKAVSQMGGQSYPTMTGPGVGPSFNYNMTSQLGPSLQIPQQYPFITQHQASPAVATSTTHSPVPAMRPVTTSIARSALVEPVPNSQRPGITADGGTYTCTYHGCTQRFETPALLQKHKREGHRQANALAGARKVDGSLSPGLLNSQAGPHRCERINPSTGKPCNTVFSRPYDLTRHEDTIHNARKQKVRCNLCTEEKTFSRADALTRHFRVCHPDVEFPGKHRKRGVHAN